MTKMLVFTHKHTRKELVSISAKEATADEVKSTRELLAYENDVKPTDIEVTES